jgi:hypothetical protein
MPIYVYLYCFYFIPITVKLPGDQEPVQHELMNMNKVLPQVKSLGVSDMQFIHLSL